MEAIREERSKKEKAKMSNLSRQVFFRDLCYCTVEAGKRGIRFIPIRFYSSAMDQAELYAQGRTKPGKIVTQCDGVIKPSDHQKWEALDFAVLDEKNNITWDPESGYKIVGQIWKSLGHTWGGDFIFRDYGHLGS